MEKTSMYTYVPTLLSRMRTYILFVVCMLCVVCTLCDDHHIENFSTYASSLDTIANKLEEPKGRWCHCWNDTESEVGDGIECRCFGYLLKTLPKKLPNGLEKLTISEAGIKVLNKNSLQPYKTALRDVILTNLAHLQVIEAGTFRNIDKLRSLYISDAPLLKSLPMLFEGVSTKNFLSLRIMHTGLEEIPDLSRINQTKILHMVDLEDNKFKHLPSNSIKVKAEQVMLNYNQISSIAGYAFDGSEIAKLSLKGNRQLTMLSDESFSGLNSVTQLDLSGTSIEYLPVKGLETMEILRIQETKSLKVIPSVYNFKYLKEAWLTHSFHCCAFMYPAQHDPVEHAFHTSKLKQFCDALTLKHDSSRSKRHSEAMWGESVHEEKSGKISFDGIWDLQFDQPDNESEVTESDDNKSENDDIETEDEIGTFHQNVFEMPGGSDVLCGKLSQSTHDILCYPKPDALNPCEDIMGSYWLRVSVWFVVVTAVIGNLAVIVVFFSSMFDISVPKFLMCHLAFADICMGFYLLLIASMDIHSMGFYFNFAFDWQIGDGCRIAGFLTVFSSQLSVYTLTIITLERWFAIRYAIYLNRRIRLGAAVKIMAVGWVYSILMASLPLFGISNYSSTSICLPMEIQDPQDRAYLVALLLTNGLAFFIIVVCYTQIYFSLGQETRRGSANNEMTIAKKMALLVFTDFACWAPIAFFGLTALAGYPLIDVTRSKILLVFFYPLNSCANPYLYAILTAQYRRDFFMLLYRCGICKKRVKQYTMTSSLPLSNQSNPVSLLARTNGRKLSKTNNFLDEALL